MASYPHQGVASLDSACLRRASWCQGLNENTSTLFVLQYCTQWLGHMEGEHLTATGRRDATTLARMSSGWSMAATWRTGGTTIDAHLRAALNSQCHGRGRAADEIQHSLEVTSGHVHPVYRSQHVTKLYEARPLRGETRKDLHDHNTPAPCVLQRDPQGLGESKHPSISRVTAPASIQGRQRHNGPSLFRGWQTMLPL